VWGSDFFRMRTGDYAGTIRALLDAGAQRDPSGYLPENPAARAALNDRSLSS